MIHPHQPDREDLSLASFNLSTSSSSSNYHSRAIAQETKGCEKLRLESQFGAQRNNPFLTSKTTVRAQSTPPLTQSQPIACRAAPARVFSYLAPAKPLFRSNSRVVSVKTQPKFIGGQKEERSREDKGELSTEENSIDMSFEFDKDTGDKILKLKLGLTHSNHQLDETPGGKNERNGVKSRTTCSQTSYHLQESLHQEGDALKFSKKRQGLGKIAKLSNNVVLAESVKLDFCEGFQSLYEAEGEDSRSQLVPDPFLAQGDQSTFFYDISGCEESRPLYTSNLKGDKRESLQTETFLFDRSVKDFQPLIRSGTKRESLFAHSQSPEKLPKTQESHSTENIFFKTEPALQEGLREDPSFAESKIRDFISQQEKEDKAEAFFCSDRETSKIFLLKEDELYMTEEKRSYEFCSQANNPALKANEGIFGIKSVSFRDNFIESSGNFPRLESGRGSEIDAEIALHPTLEKQFLQANNSSSSSSNYNNNNTSNTKENNNNNCSTDSLQQSQSKPATEYPESLAGAAFSEEIDKIVLAMKIQIDVEAQREILKNKDASSDLQLAEPKQYEFPEFTSEKEQDPFSGRSQNEKIKKKQVCPYDMPPQNIAFRSKNALCNIQLKSRVLTSVKKNIEPESELKREATIEEKPGFKFEHLENGRALDEKDGLFLKEEMLAQMEAPLHFSGDFEVIEAITDINVVDPDSPKLGESCLKAMKNEEPSHALGTPSHLLLEEAPSLVLNSSMKNLLEEKQTGYSDSDKNGIDAESALQKAMNLISSGERNVKMFRLELNPRSTSNNNIGGSNNEVPIFSLINDIKEHRESVKENSIPAPSSEGVEKEIDSGLRNDILKIEQEGVRYWEIEKMISERSNTWHTDDDSEQFKEKGSGVNRQVELNKEFPEEPDEKAFESPLKAMPSASLNRNPEEGPITCSGKDLRGTRIFYEGSISKIINRNVANKEAALTAPFSALDPVREVLREKHDNIPVCAIPRKEGREEKRGPKLIDSVGKKEKDCGGSKQASVKKDAIEKSKPNPSSIKKMSNKSVKQEQAKGPQTAQARKNEKQNRQPAAEGRKPETKAETFKKVRPSKESNEKSEKGKMALNIGQKAYKSEQVFKFRPSETNYFETARKLNFLLESSYSVTDCRELGGDTPKNQNNRRGENFCSLLELEEDKMRLLASETKNRQRESRALDLYSLYGRSMNTHTQARGVEKVFNFLQEES